MRYFLDTEFIEGYKKPISWLPTIGGFNKPYHSVELISIGIVCEDGREYYAISKDFNLRLAWNKFDIKEDPGKPQGLGDTKIYWLRENVLKPIHAELAMKFEYENDIFMHDAESWFTLPTTQKLINMYGKDRRQISIEIWEFVNHPWHGQRQTGLDYRSDPEFYAYYADYDWVVFCSIFGRMMDLPPGFPMYCRDLKQTFDEKTELMKGHDGMLTFIPHPESEVGANFRSLKEFPTYPTQENEHNALDDAKWNKKLFDFLRKL